MKGLQQMQKLVLKQASPACPLPRICPAYLGDGTPMALHSGHPALELGAKEAYAIVFGGNQDDRPRKELLQPLPTHRFQPFLRTAFHLSLCIDRAFVSFYAEKIE
jgi:hypothetical protein